MDKKELNRMIKKLENWTSPNSDVWEWYPTTAASIIERMCKLRGLTEQLIASAIETATEWGREADRLGKIEANKNG